MPQLQTNQHRVYLVDLEEPMMALLGTIADYCDEQGMYSQLDILMSSLNFLTVSHCVNEAAEAMEIDLLSVCRFQHTDYNLQRIRDAIRVYLNAMHNQFQQLGFYGQDAHLTYTFGGWHDQFTPVFIPNTHIRNYKNAIPAIVSGEPSGPPNRIFHPYPAFDDSYVPF